MVLHLLVKLELFQSGCLSSLNLVLAESARLEEDKDTFESDRVDCLLDVGRGRWRINSRFDGASARVKQENRVVVECCDQTIGVIHESIISVLETFAKGAD